VAGDLPKRNHPDFLDAYLEYAKDSYCPPQFHFWTGVSILAGAMERRCWLNRGSWDLFPNLYILLVAKPAVGKSQAATTGIKLLRKLGSAEGGNRVRILAQKNSEASFIEQFQVAKKTFLADTGSGLQEYQHSSGYFFASEGSNALTELPGGGGILSCLTEFYDCPGIWDKKLMKGHTRLENVCCNMLAGVTFSFLEELVPQRQAEGGFASRLIFVPQDEIFIRRPKLVEPVRAGADTRLIEDLNQVYSLSGPFTATPEFSAAFEDWFPEADGQRQGLRSERMQHFLGRKHTNLLKLCMVCCVSEGNDMTLYPRHWERALGLMQEVEAKLPAVVKNSAGKNTPKGVTFNVLRILQERGEGGILSREQLFRELLLAGVDTTRIDSNLQTMARGGRLAIETIPGKGQHFRLTCDPNEHL